MQLPSSFSDGAEANWPTAKEYVYQPQDKLYHRKLGAQWVVDHPDYVKNGKS
jgi:hypothetical protein